jgi:hypothetical protein
MLAFLIQDQIWEENQNILTDVLKQKNIPCFIHPFTAFDQYIIESLNSSAIFCYGSIEWIRQIQRCRDERLKTIYNLPNYDCAIYYYKRFAPFLFNKTHKFLSWNHLKSNFSSILEKYGGNIFVRPSSGCKTISAGVLNAFLFSECLETFNTSLKNGDFVLIDAVKHIDFEWRTIIKDRKCITGCQYKSFDASTQKLGFDPAPDLPDRVKIKAEEIVSQIHWSPDPIYVLDLVESNGEISVMEINALSTSGWYDCDISIMVDAILATKFKEVP